MPLVMGDITGVSITEAGQISSAGLLSRMLHVTFRLRGHGPLSIDLPREGYTPEAAETAITEYAQQLVTVLENFPGITRIGESFTLAPIGQRQNTVNFVFQIDNAGRFETAVPRDGFTAEAALTALRNYAKSLTSLTTRFGG